MAEKDYIAMWFNARRRFGIKDTIWMGWKNLTTHDVEWMKYHHAKADGVAVFADILRKLGFPTSELPKCQEAKEPSWWTILKAQRTYKIHEYPKVVHWKQTYQHPDSVEFMPECAVLTAEELAAVKAYVKNEPGLNVGNLAFSALNRIISRELIAGDDSYYWFFPVSVRGAVKIKNEAFNQASGVNIRSNPYSTPADWRRELSLRLKSLEHWKMWKLAHIGKYIGEWGLSRIYKSSSQKNFYVGSCSHLGVWPLPSDRGIQDPHPNRVLFGNAPSTRNYPVCGTLHEWFGKLVLSIKIHPFICENQQQLATLVELWREELLTSVNYHPVPKKIAEAAV